MSDHVPESQREVIHLPALSAAPIVVAAGITLALTGLLYPTLLIVGVVLLAAGIGMWAFGNH